MKCKLSKSLNPYSNGILTDSLLEQAGAVVQMS